MAREKPGGGWIPPPPAEIGLSFISLTLTLLFSKFVHYQRSGGQNFSILYLKQNYLSHEKGSVKNWTFYEKEKLSWEALQRR